MFYYYIYIYVFALILRWFDRCLFNQNLSYKLKILGKTHLKYHLSYFNLFLGLFFFVCIFCDVLYQKKCICGCVFLLKASRN